MQATSKQFGLHPIVPITFIAVPIDIDRGILLRDVKRNEIVATWEACMG